MPVLRTCRWCCGMSDFKQTTNHSKPQTKGTVLLVCLWHIQAKRTVPLVAPRLFFMFLSLILFTIRQQCTIYPQGFSTEPNSCQKSFLLLKKMRFFNIFLSVLLDFFFFLCIFVVSFQGQSTGKCANLMPH